MITDISAQKRRMEEEIWRQSLIKTEIPFTSGLCHQERYQICSDIIQYYKNHMGRSI